MIPVMIERKRWWRLAAIAVVSGGVITGGWYGLVHATTPKPDEQTETANWTRSTTPPPTVAEVGRAPEVVPQKQAAPATPTPPVIPVSATLPIPAPADTSPVVPAVPAIPAALPVPIPSVPSVPTIPAVPVPLPPVEPVGGVTGGDKNKPPSPVVPAIPPAELPPLPTPPKPPESKPVTPADPGSAIVAPPMPVLPPLPNSGEPTKASPLPPPTPFTPAVPVIPPPSGLTLPAPPVKPADPVQPMQTGKPNSDLNPNKTGNTLNPTAPPVAPIAPLPPIGGSGRETPGTTVDLSKPPEPKFGSTDKHDPMLPAVSDPLVPKPHDPQLGENSMLKVTTTAAFAVLGGALLAAEKANAFPTIPPSPVIQLPGSLVKADPPQTEVDKLKTDLAAANRKIEALEKQVKLLTELLRGKKDDQGFTIPTEPGAVEEIKQLKNKIAALETELKTLKGQTSLKPSIGAPEVKPKGIVKIVNQYPVEITMLVNNKSYHVAPNTTLEVPVPAGEFTYQLPQSSTVATRSTIKDKETVTLRIK